MPRLKKEDNEKRESYMFEIFQKDPECSVPQANLLLKSKFGSQMNSQKAYRIRKSAQAQKKSGGAGSGGSTERARNPLPQLAGHPDLALVAINGDQEGQAIARVFEDLRTAGLCTLKVVHSRPDYLLVTNS